ncbi:MAG: DUF1499 domain-containing protein, partial [Rhodothermaceae bacterium]|nr:DUF1499 domain-containing protein [Rhodothermaceae bacterium]
MPKPLAIVLPGLFVTLLMASSPSVMAQEASSDLLSSSPLDPCTSSLNCVHEAYLFDRAPSELAQITMEVLEANKYLDTVTQGAVDHHRIDAVFNAWRFKDDVQIAIEFQEGGSVLFIKSASRTGKSDLGVNKRRVNGLLKDLTDR